MMPIRPRPWRQWCAELALFVGLALLFRACIDDGAAGEPRLAFFGIWGAIVTVATTIWRIGSTAVTVAVKYALVGLQWAVTNLTKLIVSGLKKGAVYLARGVKTLGRFVRQGFTALVRNVQRAALWLKGTLSKIFKPILDFLDRVKGYVRRIYDRFIKPVLDTIEIARRMFRLLGYLGIDWARALDQKLGRIEQLISLPFEWVVGKINELIGWINRIVTVDGLLQRVMLLTSLLRDYPMTTNMWWNGQTRPLTDLEITRLRKQPQSFPTETAYVHLQQHFENGSADSSGLINEIASSIRLTLARRRP